MDGDSYPIPKRQNRAECTVKGSRFVATIDHAPCKEAAMEVIVAVRREFRGATHNCWAYLCGSPGTTVDRGAGDDGEPRGTAGRPMLAVLTGSGVGEVVAVVTRYFGGTRLGTGGLVRAYSESVRLALENLTLTHRTLYETLYVDLAYSHIDSFRRMVKEAGGHIASEVYHNAVQYSVAVPAGQVERLIATVAGATAGRAVIRREG